ncbi:MAG: hypothetical protein ACD_80C00041G0004 [uncultured bacterium (gcode 4)]|uniref:Uncharacterized protein n=1 Tax=uncultured bacterium (gcode 4) TaxID=1234023 RepID=K1X5L9_9BACT|nr:MAG: hypothetical protein ACD_80C00041G0004 [uncultured bacterium (gcode 4)]
MGHAVLAFGSIILAFILMMLIFVPKKKLCQNCNTVKTRKSKKGVPFCDNCSYDESIKRASDGKIPLLCPHDQKEMTKKMVKDLKNVIIDICPQCGTIVLNKRQLKDITIMEMDLYPEEKK